LAELWDHVVDLERGLFASHVVIVCVIIK